MVNGVDICATAITCACTTSNYRVVLSEYWKYAILYPFALCALHNILVYILSQPDGYQPQLSIVGPLHPYVPPDWPHRVD